MILETELEPPLFEACCQLDVGLCDMFSIWNSAAEEWVDLKSDLQGDTRFNLLRVQFCQLENKTLQQICYNEGSKKEPKLDPPAETF